MTQWVSMFLIPEIADVHIAFAGVIRKAEQADVLLRGTRYARPAAATLAELRRAYVDFNDNLRAVAEEASVRATNDIRARIAQTAVRPDTRSSPHLRDLIYCRPLSVGAIETGWVGIARVSTLNRAVNPNTPGYGTYWRAQEYGTGHGEVPSQVGRVLFGYFASGGGSDLTPPQAQYAGGGGPHPIFLPNPRSGAGTGASVTGYIKNVEQTRASSLRGLATTSAKPGFGTIGHEIRPRRFIGTGADGAAVQWRNQALAIQQRLLDSLGAIGVR